MGLKSPVGQSQELPGLLIYPAGYSKPTEGPKAATVTPMCWVLPGLEAQEASTPVGQAHMGSCVCGREAPC